MAALHPYFRKNPSAPRRRGMSRNIALRLWAAVFVRGATKDGRIVCAWCTDELSKDDHTIDHFNHNDRDHRPENMLPSCNGCNSARSHSYPTEADANAAMDGYLREKGQTYEAAIRRVREQLATPIPQGQPKYSALHRRAIVSVWAPNDPRIEVVIDAFLPGQGCKDAKGACELGESRKDYTRRTGAERAALSRTKRREREAEAPTYDDADDFDRF